MSEIKKSSVPATKGNAPVVDQLNIKPSAHMLEMLVCPLTHTMLDFDAENSELISKAAGLAYPVRDGIALMLPSEARELEVDQG